MDVVRRSDRTGSRIEYNLYLFLYCGRWRGLLRILRLYTTR